MPRYDDIDPGDIDPDTGRPYPGYSSPALDTSLHDHEMDEDEDELPDEDELLATPEHRRRELLHRRRALYDLGRETLDQGDEGELLLAFLPRPHEPARPRITLLHVPGVGRETWPHLGEDGELPHDDDDLAASCAHNWAYTGTSYGGDDPRWSGEGRCYCTRCGADGDT